LEFGTAFDARMLVLAMDTATADDVADIRSRS
jgi:hypothetical protein